jgi:CheY-like chemotaxis protein
LPAQQIYLDGDSARLAQVFGNLLNNACRYNHRGGHIQVRVEREGSDVVIRVKDGGIGIPPEKLEEIFEMFSQVDRSLEKTTGGLGIGLHLVRQLVQMHGGTVTAHSAGAGQGSEFIVRLPILVETPAEPRTPLADAPLPSSQGCRILVVDDNLDSANTLALLLKLAGNQTATAHDGEAAVAHADAFKPDVILLDIGLPKLNGYDACRAIRQQPRGKEIMIIALTGWGQDEDRRKSQEAGFDAHLIKPVDHQELARLLQERQMVPAR